MTLPKAGWANVFKYALLDNIRSPGSSLVVIVLCALGVGVIATAFAFAGTLLLNPFPSLEDPGSLAKLRRARRSEPGRLLYILPQDLEYQAARKDIFKDLAAFQQVSGNVTDSGPGVYAQILLVDENYFSTLGVEPILGRLVESGGGLAQESATEPVAAISYDFWQRRYGGDEAVLGKEIKVNRLQATIVGVTEESFRGLNYVNTPDVFVPLPMYDKVLDEAMVKMASSGTVAWLDAVGRLKPGVTLADESPSLDVVTQEQGESRVDPEWQIRLQPLTETAFGPAGHAMLSRYVKLLAVISSFSALVACFSAANIVVTRSLSRCHEFAIYLSLGASRGLVAFQLAIENLFLVVVGGAIGGLLAWASRSLLERLRFPVAGTTVELATPPGVDSHTIALSTGMTIFIAVLLSSASIPMLLRIALFAELQGKPSQKIWRHGSFSKRDLLLVFQISMAFAMVVGAGLFFRSFQNLGAVRSGFDHEKVLVASLDLNTVGLSGDEVVAFYETMFRRLSSVRSVDAVGVAAAHPIVGAQMTVEVELRSAMAQSTNPTRTVRLVLVGGNYFEALGLTPRIGRVFSHGETAKTPPMVVVNQTLADELWPDTSPIGKWVSLDSSEEGFEVGGVVPASRYFDIREHDVPIVFLDYRQYERYRFGAMMLPSMALVLRSQQEEPLALAPELRRVASALHPDLAVFGVTSLSDRLERGRSIERQAATILGLLALMCLLLTLVALWDLFLRAIAERSRDLAIRMACGASAGAMVRQVLSRWALLNGLGMVLGLLTSMVLARQFSPRLFQVTTWDPFTWLFSVLSVSALTLVASWLPARRIAGLDPAAVLRESA